MTYGAFLISTKIVKIIIYHSGFFLFFHGFLVIVIIVFPFLSILVFSFFILGDLSIPLQVQLQQVPVFIKT
jgi:hypothetical protein